MIRKPIIGTAVQLWYGRSKRQFPAAVPHHGKHGTIVGAGIGPGPRNIAVRIGRQVVIVPRGNLRYSAISAGGQQ